MIELLKREEKEEVFRRACLSQNKSKSEAHPPLLEEIQHMHKTGRRGESS